MLVINPTSCLEQDYKKTLLRLSVDAILILAYQGSYRFKSGEGKWEG